MELFTAIFFLSNRRMAVGGSRGRSNSRGAFLRRTNKPNRFDSC